MSPIAIYLFVKGVVDGDLVVAMAVDGVSKQLEALTMAGTVIATRMFPRGGDEEVGMDSLVQQRVDRVRARTILQQGSAQL